LVTSNIFTNLYQGLLGMHSLGYLVVVSPEAEQLITLPRLLGRFLTRLTLGDLRAMCLA
jgi:hypothetical protein